MSAQALVVERAVRQPRTLPGEEVEEEKTILYHAFHVRRLNEFVVVVARVSLGRSGVSNV